MKRLAVLISVAFATALLVGATKASGAGGLRLTRLQTAAYPIRTFVLGLPSARRLKTSDVQVTENRSAVLNPTVVPASRAGEKTFGVVLVLDTSLSMTGKPIDAAVAAESAFVAQRNRNAQLGIIEFNRSPKVSLPLTSSPTLIGKALATQPSLAPGTHIFDAVAEAEALLEASKISSGSIVVLSDGADTGSTNTLRQVARAATRKNIRIFTIGLKDRKYNARTLNALATAGHGIYKEANAQRLSPLFDQLSKQLSNQYLIQYKSLLGPSVRVRVRVRVSGLGTIASGYMTPALATAPSTPKKQSTASKIWTSDVTLFLLALLLAVGVALTTIAIFLPRGTALPERMAEFVSIRNLQRDKGGAVAAEQKAAPEPPSLWTRFAEMLEIADIRTSPEMIVVGTLVATVLVFLLIFAVTGSAAWGLFALAIPYFARGGVLRTLARRRNRFAEQLPDALQVVASALRSGHSLAGALAVVVESASEPMKSEMQRVVADEQLGIPIQTSLAVVAERMASRDVEQLALVAELQREAGGNAAEVVDRVAETVRERFDLKRLIQTLTTQGRLSRWIVSALPVGIVLFLQVENPHYLHPLLHSTGGKIVFALAAAWAVAGSFAIKKIVEIEV